MGTGMKKTDMIKALEGLLKYYADANRPFKDDREREVVTFAERVLRELQGGGPKAQTVPSRKGSESQDVVMDGDYYFGRGDQYGTG